MPVTVSQYLHISSTIFANTGAFNAIVDVDSRLFIDSHLLATTKADEMRNSHGNLLKYFSELILVLKSSKRKGDAFWREADRRFTFPELKGLCIGYTAKGTSGHGMGSRLRAQVLTTAKEIIEAGVVEPELFELVGLFEENVGADRISDMIGRIIVKDLCQYSERIYRELKARTKKVAISDGIYSLPVNSFNDTPLILIPQDILRDLPIANSFEDIEDVTDFNQRLRARINRTIGRTWKDQAKRYSKRDIRAAVLSDPELLRQLIQNYKATPAIHYDFNTDPAGQVIWVESTKEFVHQYPLPLKLSNTPSGEEIFKIVQHICTKFKQLIENNGLSALLYDESTNKHKREEAAQLVFFGVADAYCEANKLDLTREADAGRGPVDFKVSSGYKGRVLVEAKLTSNTQLLHGYEIQLPEYDKAEQSYRSIYLVIDVEGGSVTLQRRLLEIAQSRAASGKRGPTVMVVDGRRKKSASKYRPS